MKKKVKMILFAFIVLLSCGAYALVLLKPPEVETEEAVPGDLENQFTVQGTIVPKHSLVLNASVAGEVEALPYQAGMEIPEGEMLLETKGGSQTELDIQQEQFRQQLAAARQEYDRLFGETGTAELAQKAAQSEYDLAQKNYANAKILADQGGYVSQSEVNTLKTQSDLLYQKLLQSKEDNSESRRSFQRQLIASYEKQLLMLEDSVSPGMITMPYDGVLWELYTDVGSYLAPNQPVAKIYEQGDLKLEASVLSEDAVRLMPEQAAEVVYADGSRGEAYVTFISKVASKELSSIGMEESRSLVELRTDGWPEYVGGGQQVDISFTITTAKQVLTVPSSAVIPERTASIIYLVKNGRAVATVVETGRKEGGRVEVLSGLLEGDVVITDPYEENMKDGIKVVPK